MKQTRQGDNEKEFSWEILGWWDDANQDASDVLPYCIWRGEHKTGAVTLHVSNTHDQMESVEFTSRSQIDSLIESLARARDDLFPKGQAGDNIR